MAFGTFKSRTRATRYVKSISGTKRMQQKFSPKTLLCKDCGAKLQSTMTGRGMAISKKRPSRAFGGVMCGSCVRSMIKQKARSL